MSNEILSTSDVSQRAVLPRPVARVPVSVRVATMADVPFIDELQDMHSFMVGWLSLKQLEPKIAAGHVLVAEAAKDEGRRQKDEQGRMRDEGRKMKQDDDRSSSFIPHPSSLTPVGYVIAQDRYLSRDELGVIYQLNVLPMKQRSLIGATLVNAAFERAAYGCRLFCCWCAQDIQANWFWESIGFVPLAFRTGTARRQRIHIFWQRRIREGDTTTPYWFPSQTHAGVMREDRVVLPIPLGTHWRDAKPIVLPSAGNPNVEARNPKQIQNPKSEIQNRTVPVSTARKMAVVRSQSRHLGGIPPGKAAVITSGGLRYIDRGDYVPEPVPEKPRRVAKPRQKNDPKLVAAVRELRDRWMERVDHEPGLLMSQGKYEVSRRARDERGSGGRAMLAA